MYTKNEDWRNNMKISNKRINAKFMSNVLLVLGILTLLYYGYMLFQTCGYMATLIEQKEIIVSQSFGKVVQYVMTNSFSYLFYSVSLFVFAYLLRQCDQGSKLPIEKEEDNIAQEQE